MRMCDIDAMKHVNLVGSRFECKVRSSCKRPLVAVETMLFILRRLNLPDQAMKEALRDVVSFREFVDLRAEEDELPSESNILHPRRPLGDDNLSLPTLNKTKGVTRVRALMPGEEMGVVSDAGDQGPGKGDAAHDIHVSGHVTKRGLLVERSAHQHVMLALPNLCREQRAPASGGRSADRGGHFSPTCQATEAAVI